MPHLEITELVLVLCNNVNNDYQSNSKVLYTFVLNKSFSKLLDTSPKKFKLKKTLHSGFLFIELWFTDQNSKPLEIEDKLSITFQLMCNTINV